MNIAAGEAEHSPAWVLAERLPGTESVVRDAHRHEWMRAAAGRLAGALVVEVGIPLWRPDRARGHVAAHGASRVSYEVLADRLLEAGEAA